jgi:hypothetical protein
MLGASLVLILVVGLAPLGDPAELVSQLGSPRYKTREAAESSLAELGRSALPALRAARNSPDLEIQIRATGLISRIEGSLLAQSSMISLDFQDTPIDQVIQSINQQSGLTLVLNPELHPGLTSRKVTLKSSEPVPFWKAIDALCQAGKLHYIPGAQPTQGQRDGAFLLFDGPSMKPEPVSDSGPFRVLVTSVQPQAEIQLAQRRPQPFDGRQRMMIAGGDPRPSLPDLARQFSLQLLVTGEPRLSIYQNGLPKVTVAVDDKGQSLLVPSEAITFQHVAGYNGVSPSPTVRFRVDLIRPEAAGQKIRLIRGTIPVTVASRKSEPLEVPLEGSIGKLFKNEDVVLMVNDSRRARTNTTSLIELSIRPMGQVPRAIPFGEGEPFGYRPDTPQQQIEILDAEGKTLSWFPSSTFYNGDETRLTLTIVGRGTTPVPATIRYHSLVRASIDVPFEFRQLPMP